MPRGKQFELEPAILGAWLGFRAGSEIRMRGIRAAHITTGGIESPLTIWSGITAPAESFFDAVSGILR